VCLNSSGTRPTRSVAHRLLVWGAVSIDRYLRGEVAVADLLHIDGLDMARLTKLGISCVEAKLYDQARSTFRLLARLRPEHYLVHVYLGIVAEAEEDLLTAREAYERAGTLLEAQDLTPDREAVLLEIVLMLACVLIRLARTDEAVPYLEELARADHSDVQLEAQQLLMSIESGSAP
jgi:tetratricopeptide (TPR) repeat protein